MLIQFKAKVYMLSEDDMETAERDEAVGIDREGKWVYRNIAYPVEYVTSISAFDKEKTIVYITIPDSGDESFLVKEDFDSVFKRWETTLSTSDQDLVL